MEPLPSLNQSQQINETILIIPYITERWSDSESTWPDETRLIAGCKARDIDDFIRGTALSNHEWRRSAV